MVAIFLFSSQDASISSQQSATVVEFVQSLTGSTSEGLLTFLTRKAAHIFMYFVLGVLLYNVARTYSLAIRRVVIICIVIALSYAVTDEVHQLSIGGRSGEARDVLIDTTASAAGIGLYAWYGRKRHHEMLRKTVK